MDFNQQVIMLSMMTEKNSINNIDILFIIGFIIISIIFVIWLLIKLKEK